MSTIKVYHGFQDVGIGNGHIKLQFFNIHFYECLILSTVPGVSDFAALTVSSIRFFNC